MSGADANFDALRAAVEALAEREAGELVAEAEADARERVRSSLTDAIAGALLERSAAELAARHLEDAASVLRAQEPPPPQMRGAVPEGAEAPPAPETLAPPVAESGESDGEATYVNGEATYVFGVADGRTELGELAGFDERHAVRAIGRGAIAAVVATVGLDEFGEQALQKNLEDLKWIEGAARTHESVLGELIARTTVVPMRLCTIYRDDEQVAAMLDERADGFVETLERLRGHTEWGVKLIAAPGALEVAAQARGGAADADDPDLSPGLAYLDRKQRQQRARGDVEEIAAALADDAHGRLAAVSNRARLNKLQARELGGHSGDMILNGAYLVDDEGFDRFEGAIAALRDDLARDAVEVEMTGPWPAYNFAAPEDDGDPGILRVAG